MKLYIKQKVFSWRDKFAVMDEYERDWQHEYAVSSNQGEIMHISKAWLTWGDFYELDINNPQDELLCLCIALAIDCISADAAGASAASSSH